MKELFVVDDTSHDACLDSFRRIAEHLMNKCQLVVESRTYRIVDCEFYYHSSGHQDCYVHGHQRQKESAGEWYFHGSGIDITIGGDKIYGGILIRGIAEIGSNSPEPFIQKSILGPINVCTEIFKSFGSVGMKAIQFGMTEASEEQNNAMLVPAKVFAVPRVGLNREKDTHDYHDRPYRFISFLCLPHKENDKIKRYLTKEAKLTVPKGEFKDYKDGKRW